jgi:hypothetical protein
MNRRLLRHAQFGTVAGGFLVGVVAAVIWSLPHGLGVIAGAGWAALNLRTLEGLIAATVIPGGDRRRRARVFLWFLAKMGVYGSGLWILIVRPFPVIGMVVGLTVMLAALVLAGSADRSITPREATPRGDDADA